ncbi:phage major tail tube protein [Siccibacter turicensis]|jgi:P2 family phage contractile tail tube protein|uniref:Phage major tail tube protein n=1 Tax=Siccibacter turicensis TaxID=357233 RepID=A0A2P8VEK9_9ENTR|nr:phage major tail tube protein [Siccibacter turicensis]PSN05976.1 phage major tail tube protein [Siccibacter turicensis]
MAMPRKLKLMNVFMDGYSYMGVAKSMTLPKLTRKLENYRGAGMNGSAPVDLGLDDDALSLELSLGGFPDEVIWKMYGSPNIDAAPIRFAGSYQRDDTGEVVAVEVSMRGRIKEIDTGEGKQGEDTEAKLSVACTYFKLSLDGKELVEIDTINMIERVNGTDRLEQHRRNIGL